MKGELSNRSEHELGGCFAGSMHADGKGRQHCQGTGDLHPIILGKDIFPWNNEIFWKGNKEKSDLDVAGLLLIV